MSSSPRGEKMNKEADSPASAQQKDTPMGRHPLASLWFHLLLAEEKVWAKKKHSFCFLCLLPKHHRIQPRQSVSPQTYILRCLRSFSRKSLPPGCLPRLVITLGLCKLEGVLDLTALTVKTTQLLSLPSAFLSLVLGGVPV